ncbi:hypothetical protein BC940DRAFT_288571 [Gongronella butleri]|nr:hypothetical protein BC940DRAFT_288571 [Gongronella butleri]
MKNVVPETKSHLGNSLVGERFSEAMGTSRVVKRHRVWEVRGVWVNGQGLAIAQVDQRGTHVVRRCRHLHWVKVHEVFRRAIALRCQHASGCAPPCLTWGGREGSPKTWNPSPGHGTPGRRSVVAAVDPVAVAVDVVSLLRIWPPQWH